MAALGQKLLDEVQTAWSSVQFYAFLADDFGIGPVVGPSALRVTT